MQDDAAPPSPLPPAAQPPWPSHPAPTKHAFDPAPHGATGEDVARAHPAAQQHSSFGTLGFALVGGAIAAAVGLAVALPLLRGEPKRAPANRGSSTRRTAQPRAPKKPRTASTPGPKPGSKRTPKPE